VLDLGCWPGGWLQAAAQAAGPRGRIVGIDVAAVDPPLADPRVTSLIGDLEDPQVCEQILKVTGGPAQVVISDAAPKLTGIRTADRALEERLLEAIQAILPQLLRPGGNLLLKILDGPEAQLVDRRIRGDFERAKTVKCAATRKGSRERYTLAWGYKGPSSEDAGAPEEPAERPDDPAEE
jgi:23S rRNA (uridine2552-2'-O)-methyltransferase